MKITLTLPQLGLTQTEGAVSEWLKKTGDAVKKDEAIFVVSTDKADMEIEAPSDGIMGDILIEPGITVPVGEPLAYLVVEGEESSEQDAPSPIEADAPSPTEADTPEDIAPPRPDSSPFDRETKLGSNGREYPASPRARRLAREIGVDLSKLQGTGPGNRIVEADVRAAASAVPAATNTVRASAAPPSADARRRLLIADRMTESIRNIPAFSVTLEVNAAKLVDLYESVRGQFAQSAKLTYTDLLLKGVSIALHEMPLLNSGWVESGPQAFSGININLAVATDKGVTAPVIRNVDQLSLEQLARERAGLMEKSRASRLSLAEVENGAGTLSNLGMYRVDRFEGIITPGQSFIVSVGKLGRRPWVAGDTLIIQPTLHLTVSVDHRIADGAQAATFLERIAEAIEKPYLLLWGKN